MFKKRIKKRGQVTIFIIIAIIIVASIAGYFVLRSSFITPTISSNLEPVYNAFLSCLEENVLEGITTLEAQGGYIELPEFESGSAHMPFSSQLNFLGNPIPYWYYVSGSNIQKEQVPSISDIEEQLGNYIEAEISDCILDSYFEQGFAINLGEPEVDINIRKGEVEVILDMNLGIEKAEESVVVSNHNIIVKTKLGDLYESAKKIYDYEQETLFLENYGIDVLRLYAPVDGVELTCSPLIWNANDVFEELKLGIEANTMALRAKTNEFTLKEKENKYFVLDLPIEEEVRFLNSRNWTYAYEVEPSEGVVLSAHPVGNQPGMAVLGFCYVPYHFVYNVKYPVLVQIYSGMEIFQFPMAVVIQGNKPREALNVSAVDIPDPELCKYYNTPMQVNTYDNYLNPIPADISFQCFGQTCPIGKTSSGNGSLIALFPQCVNGFVVAKADGYQRTKEQVSSIEDNAFIDIILRKLYEKEVSISLDGRLYTGETIITFVPESGEGSTTIVYPEQKQVKLTTGQYEVQVYIYKSGELKLSRAVQEQCMEVPISGLGGIFGVTQEKCFDIVIPEQTVSNALGGGGKQEYYVAESELETSTIIDINVDSLPTPRTIEDLQQNFIVFEDKGLDIYFR